jgi:hypothetical protein
MSDTCSGSRQFACRTACSIVEYILAVKQKPSGGIDRKDECASAESSAERPNSSMDGYETVIQTVDVCIDSLDNIMASVKVPMNFAV